jgi:hypothetical protein
LDRRLGGNQSRSGVGGEKKNSQSLPGLELPIIQPVAQRHTTELTRLLLTITKKRRGIEDSLRLYINTKLELTSMEWGHWDHYGKIIWEQQLTAEGEGKKF